jgi:hypothetical protein
LLVLQQIAFFQLASGATELHFESVSDQIDYFKAQLPATPPMPDTHQQQQQVPEDESTFPVVHNTKRACVIQPAREGDTFVTRHSNLGETQIVYHLVTPNTASLAEDDSLALPLDDPLVLGFRNIVTSMSLLCLCLQCSW